MEIYFLGKKSISTQPNSNAHDHPVIATICALLARLWFFSQTDVPIIIVITYRPNVTFAEAWVGWWSCDWQRFFCNFLGSSALIPILGSSTEVWSRGFDKVNRFYNTRNPADLCLREDSQIDFATGNVFCTFFFFWGGGGTQERFSNFNDNQVFQAEKLPEKPCQQGKIL